ncbi:MAG: putative conserved protein YqhQ [Chloroflexi bacterium]|jgi:uncharacterized protein YqhQ|nr:MAG: putative conserved protein YqhQ [Chloroflexota bacterium]
MNSATSDHESWLYAITPRYPKAKRLTSTKLPSFELIHFSDLSRTAALGARLLITPLLAGISLEILFIGDPSKANKFTSLVAAPGLLLQRLTTASPSDEQIEVALHALKAAVARDSEAMEAN